MNGQQKQAMQMALEALEEAYTFTSGFTDKPKSAIAALREHLAQPDHIANAGKVIEPSDYDREFWGDGQPVAWMHTETKLLRLESKPKGADFDYEAWTPLYTIPQPNSYKALELVAHTQESMKAHAAQAARQMKDTIVDIIKTSNTLSEAFNAIASLPIIGEDNDQ